MTAKQLLIAAWLWAGASALGCVGIQVGGQVQAGRNALQTGRPTMQWRT